MEENRNQVGNRHIGRKLTTARPVKLNEGERNRHRFVRSELKEGRKESCTRDSTRLTFRFSTLTRLYISLLSIIEIKRASFIYI